MIPETIEQNPKLPTTDQREMSGEPIEPVTPEKTLENALETIEQPSTSAPVSLPPRTINIPPPTPRQIDELMARVEKIMEEDLGDAYNRLSPIAKQEFKMKGERTATTIRQLLKETKLKVKKIFTLILNWLKLLPGINHFFLEQEAKIKTDRLIELHKTR